MLKRFAKHSNFVEYFDEIFAIRLSVDLILVNFTAKKTSGDNGGKNF